MDADFTFELDLDSLKISEIEAIEEIMGVSIDEIPALLGDGKPKAKMLRVIGYIVKKRDDPTFTMEQAGELVVRISTLNGEAGNGHRPTKAGASKRSPRSATSTPATRSPRSAR